MQHVIDQMMYCAVQLGQHRVSKAWGMTPEQCQLGTISPGTRMLATNHVKLDGNGNL